MPTRPAPLAAQLAALTAAALAVAFYRLGAKDLWLDEAVSANLARVDLRSMAAQVPVSELNGVLHLALLHVASMFGRSEVFLRAPSALCAAAAVPVTYLLGVRLWSRRAGLAAALLLCGNGFFLRYAQEARTYALVLLLATVSSLLFLRAVESDDAKAWASYALGAALLLPAHVLGVLIPLAHAAALLSLPPAQRPSLRRAGLAALGIGALDLPLVAWFAAHRQSHQIDWLPQPTWLSLPRIYLSFAGGSVLLALWLSLSAAALAGGNDARAALRRRLLAAWLLLPPVAVLALSLAVRPLLLDRYLIGVLPAFALAAGVGLARLPRAWFAPTLAVLLAAGAVPCFRWYSMPRSDWRPLTQALLERRRPGDALLVLPTFSDAPISYYLDAAGAPQCVPFHDTAVGNALREVKPPSLGDLEAAGRLWVVESPGTIISGTQRDWVDSAHARLAGRGAEPRLAFGGKSLQLFEAREQ